MNDDIYNALNYNILGIGAADIKLVYDPTTRDSVHLVFLILPSINIIFSLVSTLSTFLWFQKMIPKSYEKIDEFGNLLESVTTTPDWGSVIFTVIAVFLICNISTLILMTIYWVSREKAKKSEGNTIGKEHESIRAFAFEIYTNALCKDIADAM